MYNPNPRFLFLFLFYLFLYNPLFSQSVRHITVNDGLPQSFVSGIEQDKEGFIWISTRNGLVKFDGNNFETFQHNPNDDKTLSSNLISSIKLSENELWISYESGELDAFNLLGENIKHVVTGNYLKNNPKPDLKNSAIDTTTLWYFTDFSTLIQFDYKNDVVKEFSFPSDTIRSIFKDRKNKLWVLTSKYLKKFDSTENRFSNKDLPFRMNFNDTRYFGFDVPELLFDNNENIVWGDKNFLYKYNSHLDSFEKIMLPESLDASLSNLSLINEEIRFLANKKYYTYKDSIKLISNLPIEINKKIKSYLIDNAGLLWVAPDTDGIYQIDFSYKFKNFRYKKDFVSDILKTHYNISDKDILQAINKADFALPSSYYLRSTEQNDKIWIALNQTVFFSNLSGDNYIKLPLLKNTETDKFDPIVGITIIQNSTPLVITENRNISVYNDKLEIWENYFSTQFSDYLNKQQFQPNAILFKDDKLWITTKSKGLLSIAINNSNKHSLNEASLSIKDLISLEEDRNCENILWIASHSGLIRYDIESFEKQVYSTKEGLPDNTIYSILPDNEDNLWIGTNNGLVRFNTQDYSQKTFTQQHGISLLEYNRHHKLYLPNGLFSFGGSHEGIVFNPQLIEKDLYRPNTAITSIEINNELLDYKKNINDLDNLKLSPSENNLIIHYSALQYNQPEDIKYRYRLLGYDNDNKWKKANKRTQAIYTKVPSGEYTFEVNSSNTSGIWSNKIKKLKISIATPWWNKLWAWILYSIILISLIFVFIKYQVKQKVIEKEIEIKRKEAIRLRELDEIKTKFFSNITHELRTPLSLILAPAEYLKESLSKKEQKSHLQIILRNAKSLLQLTNQLLDLSKIQAGVLKPSYSDGNIEEVIENVIQAFQEEVKSKKIDLSYKNSITQLYSFSKEFLERIIYNLLSNAIKYNIENGKIRIYSKEEKNGITISIKDTGIGIPDSHLKDIFERYYREKHQEKTPGSGIGLALVEELVKLQNGKITVQSKTGKNSGTTFTIFFPYNKAKVDHTEKNKNTSTSYKKESSSSKLLIIEDNPDLREFLQTSLKEFYTIYLAKNGEEGVKIAEDTIPDIIVSDVMMNEMDGFEVCNILKNNQLTAHIPIILLTAKNDNSSKIKGLSIGADDYIVKPFNLQELILKLRNLLDLKQKQRKFIYKNLNFLEEASKTKSNEKIIQQDPFLEKFYKLLDERIKEENFNIEELGTALNMSRTSLYRKLKAVTDMSPTQLIKIYRLQKAIELLRKNYSISEVAYETGFGSPSYFSKCFKEIYKITPSEYLKKNTP